MPLHGLRLLQANAKGIQWRQLGPFYSQTTQLKAFGILQGCSLTPVLDVYCHYWKWYIRALWSILSLCKVSKHSSMAKYIKVQSLTPNCPLKFHLNTVTLWCNICALLRSTFQELCTRFIIFCVVLRLGTFWCYPYPSGLICRQRSSHMCVQGQWCKLWGISVYAVDSRYMAV